LEPRDGAYVQVTMHQSNMVKITLRHRQRVLVKWARDKFKNLRCHQRSACHWLGRVARKNPKLFVLWQIEVMPASESHEPNAQRGARSVR